MNDREKVIKGLEDSLTNQCCGFMDGVGELYAVSGEDLQNAIAMLKEQPHWVPAEERLPKSMINKVIVYVQHEDLASRIGFGHFEKYHGVGTWWDLERDEPFIKHGFTVTHWMPIPKSPYGEELILS